MSRPARGLWSKAPLLLLRFPGALVALAVAGLVLGAAAGSRRLYQGSIDTAVVQGLIGTAGAGESGMSVIVANAPATPDRAAFRDPMFSDLVRGVPHLSRPVFTAASLFEAEVGEPATPDRDGTVVMATRTGFEGHLDVVETVDGPGWWIARSTSELTGAHPGDELLLRVVGLGGDTGQRATIRVAGVYEDLAHQPSTDYWKPLAGFIYKGGDPLAEIPPPMILADRETFFATAAGFAGDTTMRWEAAVEPGLTLPQARALAASLDRAAARFEDPREQFSSAFDSQSTNLRALVEDAVAATGALRPPVDAVAAGGVVVAFALMVAAGVFALQQRRTEYAALSTRGVGPLALGARTAVEALAPVALGAAAGWVAARAAIGVAGPSPQLAGTDVTGSVRDVAVLVAAALVALGAVTAGAARIVAEREVGGGGARAGRLRRVARAIPWEAFPLAVAALVLVRLGGDGPAGAEGAPTVDLLVPLFPVLFVTGAGGLALRLLRRGLPAVARAGRRAPTAAYLALRRLASVPRSALTLVLVGALAVGILGYASIAVASAARTAERKASVFVGAPVAIGMNGRVPLPAGLPPHTTVGRLSAAATDRGAVVTVLAVDPATFPDAASWDGGFADLPLRDLMDRLAAPADDGAVPAVVAGPSVPLGALDLFGRDVPTRVVATAETFPGMTAGFPLVVVATDRLEAALGSTLESFGPRFEIWVDGPAGPVLRALRRDGFAPQAVRTAADVGDQPDFRALGWVFGYMRALGVVVTAVALAGVGLYLGSRLRARALATALAGRMGLRRRSGRRSVALELLGLLTAAVAVGTGSAALAAVLVRRELEVMPDLPPGGVIVAPVSVGLAVAAGVVVFSWVAAWWVHRRAERANVAEVMRYAG